MHRSVWISDTSKTLRVLGTCADAGFLPRGGVPRGKIVFWVWRGWVYEVNFGNYTVFFFYPGKNPI